MQLPEFEGIETGAENSMVFDADLYELT